MTSALNLCRFYALGPELFEEIRPMIEKEVRMCDDFGGFVVLHSLAGGTGSGLGSCFTSQLRLCYRHSLIFNFSILPFVGGEVVVQDYNFLLTISTIYQVV